MLAEDRHERLGYTPIRPAEQPPTGLLQRRRPMVIAGALVFALAIGSFWYFTGSSPAAASTTAATVEITSQGFVPATITVRPGQTITWTNEDVQPHQPATDPYPLENGLAGFVDPDPLQTGQSYSFTFTTPGTYTYHDHLDPLAVKGSVIVQ